MAAADDLSAKPELRQVTVELQEHVELFYIASSPPINERSEGHLGAKQETRSLRKAKGFAADRSGTVGQRPGGPLSNDLTAGESCGRVTTNHGSHHIESM
jgi:hypothetical protein